MSPGFNSNLKTQMSGDDLASSSVIGKRNSFDVRKHDQELESATKRSKVSHEQLNKNLMTPPRPLGTSKSRTTVPKPRDELLRQYDVKSISKNLFFEEFERISHFHENKCLKQPSEGHTPFFRKAEDAMHNNPLIAFK